MKGQTAGIYDTSTINTQKHTALYPRIGGQQFGTINQPQMNNVALHLRSKNLGSRKNLRMKNCTNSCNGRGSSDGSATKHCRYHT